MNQPFHVPDGCARRAAIGPVAGLPAPLRRALTPGKDFKPMRSPQPGDWLAEYGERGQTYEEFVRSHPRRPDGAHRKIAVQPIGVFDPDGNPPLAALQRCVELFFGLAGEVLPPLPPADHEFTSRIDPVTKKRQIHAGEVLHYLWRTIPPDAFCIIAVTREDLYPDPAWNYVFGQASLTERIGVVSFARYDPAFFGRRRNASFRTTLLRRSCKVICHETGHMLGLEHCIYFRCVMNGGNNLREATPVPCTPVPCACANSRTVSGLTSSIAARGSRASMPRRVWTARRDGSGNACGTSREGKGHDVSIDKIRAIGHDEDHRRKGKQKGKGRTEKESARGRRCGYTAAQTRLRCNGGRGAKSTIINLQRWGGKP